MNGSGGGTRTAALEYYTVSIQHLGRPPAITYVAGQLPLFCCGKELIMGVGTDREQLGL